jgi:hypothetical protein
MTTPVTPQLGEVWEDAEGCLYVIVTLDGRAMAFGSPYLIDLYKNELVALPMLRIFLEDGTLDENFAHVVNYDYIEARLRYPHGHNVTRKD